MARHRQGVASPTAVSRGSSFSSSSLTPVEDNKLSFVNSIPSNRVRPYPQLPVSAKQGSSSFDTQEFTIQHATMDLPPSGPQSSSYVASNGNHHNAYYGNWPERSQMYQALAPRSMTSANWRGPRPPTIDSITTGVNNYSLAGPNTSPGVPNSDAPVSISDCLNGYAYCVQRPDGKYTRLVPADMLPALNEVPAKQASAQGMVLLPDLHMQPPQGVAKMNQPMTVKNRIDRIVATSPAQQRRTKIYCDKWIHDGTCAFTQQGCKYKHEMPFDKATQQSLGLFHGFPKWWKDLQEDLQKRHNKENPARRPQSVLQQDWRGESNEDTPSPATAQAPIGAERQTKAIKGRRHSPPTNEKPNWVPAESQRPGPEGDWVITPSALKAWAHGRDNPSPRSSAGSVENHFIH
ncbi:hypothetical protein CEP54_003451 [Fusarium duplospermum]|uniref:C3H1-type domain-containing protein n=1 Tax=Fusarium duplospermum TaxID=1325734 RepID=A0A428QNR2_9HYPO|nr:hypothetical protein CEP54_003451 [Fusarium duplospermum]